MDYERDCVCVPDGGALGACCVCRWDVMTMISEEQMRPIAQDVSDMFKDGCEDEQTQKDIHGQASEILHELQAL